MRTVTEDPDYTPHAYRDALKRMGAVLSYTRGVSMRPLIYQGTGYVGIIENPDGEYEVDDVLLFEQVRQGKTVGILHRIVRIEGEGDDKIYITRGDNCLGCERVPRAYVIGRAETIYWRRKSVRPWSRRLWVPRLIGAQRDDTSYSITVRDKGYLKYVRVWNALWPARRLWYKARALAHRLCPEPIKRLLRPLR